MNPNNYSILILARGNELLGDEGVTVKAARAVKQNNRTGFEIDEMPVLNFSLLESIEGYNKVLLLDAIKIGDYKPGSVVQFSHEEYAYRISNSPQNAGLPDLLLLAKRLEMKLPSEIRILAIEIEDSTVLSESLSEQIEAALPQFIEQIKEILQQWGCAL
ncbi:MAG: hydrogenase maturation protease [bacterium]